MPSTFSGGVSLGGKYVFSTPAASGFSCAVGSPIKCTDFETDPIGNGWSAETTSENILTSQATFNPYAGTKHLKIEYWDASPGSSTDGALISDAFAAVSTVCIEGRVLLHRCTSATGECAGNGITESASSHNLVKLFRLESGVDHEAVFDLEETTSNQVMVAVFGTPANHYVSPTTIWTYDQYNSIKFYLVLDSPVSASNGTLKYWYNGTLLINEVGTVNWRDTGTSSGGWTFIRLGAQNQNSSAQVHRYHLWDNFGIWPADNNPTSGTSCN